MAQNIYDRPDFFAGYSALPRSIDGLAAAPEWPMLQSMLPAMSGRRVVDLGCGFGWFCRWARTQGADDVLGLDISELMLARARAMPMRGIHYERTDLDTLNLPPGAFDLAYSSLALHYVANVARLFATVHQALVPGGHLVFSTEHPIYMATRRQGFVTDDNGERSWPIDGYQNEGARTTDWLTSGVIKYHRTIATTLNSLIRTGFVIDRVEEFGPSAEQVAAQPKLEEERDRPAYLLVATHR